MFTFQVQTFVWKLMLWVDCSLILWWLDIWLPWLACAHLWDCAREIQLCIEIFFGRFHESLDNFADFTKQQGTHASLSVATPVTELRFKVSIFCKVKLYSCLYVTMVFVSLRNVLVQLVSFGASKKLQHLPNIFSNNQTKCLMDVLFFGKWCDNFSWTMVL
jgi:hypothetical protein